MRAEPATPAEISQLRSVVGSLSWLSRVCRPDIGFGVNQLQAVQQKAKVDDLLTANRLLSYAMGRAFTMQQELWTSTSASCLASMMPVTQPAYKTSMAAPWLAIALSLGEFWLCGWP